MNCDFLPFVERSCAHKMGLAQRELSSSAKFTEHACSFTQRLAFRRRDLVGSPERSSLPRYHGGGAPPESGSICTT